MKKLKLLLSLLVALQCTSIVMAAGTTYLDTISTIQHIAETIQVTANSIQFPEEGDIKMNLDRDKLGDLLRPFKEICIQIDETKAHYSQYAKKAMNSLGNCISDYSPLSSEIDDIWNNMYWISSQYEDTIRNEVLQDYYEVETMKNVAKWATSFELPNLLRELHLALVGNNSILLSRNIFVELAHKYETCNQMCKSMQTTQHFLYSLYLDIALAKLKAYGMMESAYVIRRLIEKEKFTQQTQNLRWDYGNRTENVYNALRKAMEGTNRIVYRCDPIEHVPYVTYDEVTRLLQGYIENEVDLSAKGSCSQTCGSYQNARSEGCFNSDSKFCAQQPKCSGHVYNCQFVDSDMTVCQAPSESNRRYDFIEYGNGRLLGQSKKCERGTTNKVESWRRWIFWQCSYCFCLCDEQGPKSDRYFNLRESIADVQKNKVVTGLRFIKKNRVFHLQIQQGTLLPRGIINETTLDWKPIDEYHIDDENIAEGVDYHTMNYSSRSVDLDNIMNTDDNSFVVTGVRFRVLGSHLNLMAQICRFDFKSGRLLEPEVNSVWQSNDDENRKKLNLDYLDVLIRTFNKSMPLSKHNQYLDFVNSGMDRDAAQTSVPFIDIQDVVSYPPAPLAGIGLYYKGSPGFDGFLAPKIITYDFSPPGQESKSHA